MNSGRKIFYTAMAVVAVAAGGWLCFRSNVDRVHQGRRLSVWFEQRQREQVQQSNEAFISAGAAAVPFLIDRLKYHDPIWTRTYSKFYFSLNAVKWQRIRAHLPSPEPDRSGFIRWKAAHLLGQMGETAKPAVPELAKALKDESDSVIFAATEALSNLGPSARQALPVMLDALRDQKLFTSGYICTAISSVGCNSPEILPPLVQMLNEGDELKIHVLRIFAALGPAAVFTEPEINRLLVATNADVRFAAVKALWRIDPSRRVELVPKFEEFAKSPDEGVREEAGLILAKLRPLNPLAAELVANVARKGSDSFCWSAFGILSRQGRDGSNGVPMLIEALNAENPRIAAKAAAALGDVARPEKRILDELARAAQHKDLMVRGAAREAMSKVQIESSVATESRQSEP